MNTLSIALSLGIVLLLLLGVAHWARRIHSVRKICRLFELNPADYRLLGTDLNTWLPTCKLRLSGLSGIPDAAFIQLKQGAGFIGEYKSRRHKGFVKRYERYQTILYMGLLKEKYRLNHVIGAIRFADHCVAIPFDEHLYQQLLELRSEYRKSRRQGIPLESRPLHLR